ncbi:MAG: putative DNA binding domain-containing protein [Crocinitomicaceae bacterium]|nr:putative DNA binding domain-containing protein [Crocinitomicaceae bacterium]
MNTENKNTEYKSLKKVTGKSADFKALAETCVCLANAQGGMIFIGIEDEADVPPQAQKIGDGVINEVLKRLRDLTDSVGLANAERFAHENGGEYFSFSVLPSSRTIATTTSGKVFIRVGDECVPVGSDELTRLAAEKNAFQWELVTPFKMGINDVNLKEVSSFLKDIRASKKVSDFVKAKNDTELLEHYMLIRDGLLTNLGILWFGFPAQRGRIAYPISVQYLVYNDKGEKIRKLNWSNFDLNPKDLLLEIEKTAVELNYATEFPNGLFRKQVPHYAKEVIRELLVNAVAHKRYTISGDVFIEVYSDRLEITNPGGLPMGISKDNILHERQRRNPHLINILHDLGLMEGEGSGYDLIFEKLSRDGKTFPEIESDLNKLKVTVRSNTVDDEVLGIIDFISNNYSLTQKEIIVTGIVAQHKKIMTTTLSHLLQLPSEDRLRNWVGTLIQQSILISRGIKKGTEYLINPKIYSSAKINIKPSLKTIEPHRLGALIEEDLKYHLSSSKSEIHVRLGDISIQDVQKTIYKLVKEGVLIAEGPKKNRKYSLAKNK